MLKRANPQSNNKPSKSRTVSSGNDTSSSTSSDNETKLWRIIAIIVAVILIIYFLSWSGSWSWSNNKPSRDYSATCIWSNGYTYSRPVNAFCDNRMTPQWRSCEQWYKAIKWEWQVWRYCRCSSERFYCSSAHDNIVAPMETEYNRLGLYLRTANVNRYSSSAVNYYNAQVAIHNELASRINKYMSENCDCD